MDCLNATQLMSQGLERRLSTQERVGLRVHTWMCTGCRHYRQQLGVLREAAQHMAHGLVPPPESDDTPPPV